MRQCSPKVVGVQKILVHPSYSSSSSSPTANVALVKLSSPVGDSYSKLCLAAQDSEVTGAVVLVGWRISEVVGSLNQSLQSLPTDIVAQSDCGLGSGLICTSSSSR